MSEVIYLTQEGQDHLKEELHELKTVQRQEVVRLIKEAKDFGDLSENSEYEDAKNRQAFLESRITEIEKILREAKVANTPKGAHTVSLGATVILESQGEKDTYTIVGSTEANPLKGKISVESPTSKALAGHKVGEKVTVQAPSGKIEYLIKDIKF